jgi:hypothetical protein
MAVMCRNRRRWILLKEFGVEADRLLEVADVQGKLDPAHLSSIHSRRGRFRTSTRSPLWSPIDGCRLMNADHIVSHRRMSMARMGR